jgi:hypothetical protein
MMLESIKKGAWINGRRLLAEKGEDLSRDRTSQISITRILNERGSHRGRMRCCFDNNQESVSWCHRRNERVSSYYSCACAKFFLSKNTCVASHRN